MLRTSRVACSFLIVLGVCLGFGCSDKSTEPGDTPSPLPTHLWSKQFGDENQQILPSVAVDAAGNTIVAGFFEGTVDFGGGALTSAGEYDIFIAKFGSDGSHLWSMRFGDEAEQTAMSVAVDASGNVLVAGHFEGTVDFGGGALTSAGYIDIFVAKFGSDGAHQWSMQFGDWAIQWATSVAVDASGNVIIAGTFTSTVDFGGGTLTSAGDQDIFVAKFGTDGAHLWSKRFGDEAIQRVGSVTVDASGNVIIAGSFKGAVDFDGGTLTSAGDWDIYVATFGSDGAHQWSKRFGDGAIQYAKNAAVDASGNVIIAGDFEGAVNFGGGTLTSAGELDGYVAKFGSDGAHQWSKRFGDGASQNANFVAADDLGNVIIAGGFESAVNFGGGGLTSAGDRDIYVAMIGSDGAHQWSTRFGDAAYQTAFSVAVDVSSNVIVAGHFDGTIDFGGGTLTSAGNGDYFVVKFIP